METKEKKRAVLKAAKPTGKQDSYGNYSFALEFDNGDSGFLSSKNDQIGSLGFVVNQAVDYEIEKKVSQKGTEYFKIYKPKPEFNGNGSKAPFNPAVEERKQRMIVAQSSYERAMEYWNHSGKAFNLQHTDDTAKHIYNWVMSMANSDPAAKQATDNAKDLPF